MAVYKACIISTPLYGSEAWTRAEACTAYAASSALHGVTECPMPRSLNTLASSPCTHSSDKRRLRWHGHVRRMEDGRMPKDILYSELASGKRSVGCPQLRYKVVCKRDLKALDIQTQSCEDMAADGSSWRSLRFRDSSKQGRSRSIPWPRKREPDERHAQVKQTQRPSTPVSDVEKSAFRKSDCLVTPTLCQP